MKKIKTPLTKSVRTKLKCGEEVLLSGTVYTARDAAHKKLARLIVKKKRLPFDVKDAVIYYAGPTPQKEDRLFGSCGPTTSSRMDKLAPFLLRMGLGAMIGKGRRSLSKFKTRSNCVAVSQSCAPQSAYAEASAQEHCHCLYNSPLCAIAFNTESD